MKMFFTIYRWLLELYLGSFHPQSEDDIKGVLAALPKQNLSWGGLASVLSARKIGKH
jgi:hypothetical protein